MLAPLAAPAALAALADRHRCPDFYLQTGNELLTQVCVTAAVIIVITPVCVYELAIIPGTG